MMCSSQENLEPSDDDALLTDKTLCFNHTVILSYCHTVILYTVSTAIMVGFFSAKISPPQELG